VGSGTPDPEVIRKCFPELILDINKAVGLGYFYLQKKVEEKRGHNLPLY
jgi:hypothetical protein